MPVFESSSETHLAKGPEDLWRLMTEAQTASQWLTSSRPINLAPAGDLKLGTTIEMVMEIGPWRRKSIRVISEFDPPRRLSLEGFGGTVTFVLDDAGDGGTRVTVSRSASMGGCSAWQEDSEGSLCPSEAIRSQTFISVASCASQARPNRRY